MIDMDRLLQFCDNDAELAMQFLEMFRDKSTVAVTEMPVFAGKRDWEALSNSAHKMKSQCRYVGADSLAEIAAGIEFACDKGEFERISELIAQFNTGMRELLETF